MDRIYAPWRSKYFSKSKENGCLFCGVEREDNDEQMGLLARGSYWFVILNMFPYTNGHVMIAANRHVGHFGELSVEEGRELVDFLARCERAIQAEYRPDGMNIGVNIGASAGAGVEGHLHVHICPRWQGDTNFMTVLSDTRVVSEALEKSFGKLAPHFK